VAAAGAAAIVIGFPVAAAAAVASPGQTGPYPVTAEGTPGLCWQAAGNGSPVTLEHCDQAVQGQQWTLTSNGVFMNGNGYCLEAGTGDRLFIGFDGQCGGTATSQQWAFRGGQLRSRAAAVCAAPAGSLEPGTAIVTGACGRAPWSFGASAAGTPAPKSSPRPVTARPATQPSVKAGSAKSAVTGPAAGQGDGEQAVLMTVGLLVFGGLLVLVGRRSRRGGRTAWAARTERTERTGGPEPAGRAGRSGRTRWAADGTGTEAGGRMRPGARAGRSRHRRGADGTGTGTGMGGRMRPGARAGHLDDSGPFVVDVVDVTEEERQRRAARGVVDARPTEPFDVSSIF
jgi:hypothetical protein